MKHPLRHLLLGLGTALFLAACGGGGGGSDAPATNAPTARASADATSVSTGQAVTLDGSASTSPNGTAITYQWSVEQRPAGSTAALSAPTAAQSSFTPDLPGNYTIGLVVNDGRASSTAALVSLQVSNPNPVAVVIPQVSQLVNTTVQLDGSGSLAPEGASASGLSYAWTLTEKPTDSTAALDSAALAQPRFTADKVGNYQAVLVVSHGTKTSAPATVTIAIGQVNALPVAKADAGAGVGTAISVTRGTKVSLDGSTSTDADGDKLQYRWSLQVPAGSKAKLENANTAKASFTPDFAGQYTASLSVFDGTAQGGSAVGITATKPAGEANSRPVAVIAAPYGKTFEVEREEPFALQGASSYDPDGTYISSANREWKLLSAPDGFDAATNFNKPFTGFLPSEVKGTHYGNYVVQLRVFDGELWSEPVTATYTVINGANRPPSAGPGLQSKGTAVKTGATVTLTGAGSSDPDANRLTYAWTFIDKPDGSSATLLNANTETPSFVADRTGPYVFTLVVTDEHGFSSAAATLTVMAKASNQAPVGRLEVVTPPYTIEQPLLIGDSGTKRNFAADESHALWNGFELRANGYDPDGEQMSYLWTLSQEPAGNAFQLPLSGFCATTGSGNWPGKSVVAFDKWRDDGLAQRIWTCSNLGLAPTVTGLYQVQLAISDGIDFAGPYTVNLHAATRADYPTLLLENMNRAHAWSNNDQTLVLRAFDAALGAFAGQPQQELFPVDGFKNTRNSLSGNEISSANLVPTAFANGFREDIVVRTLRLTAHGGDYTITDLKATDSTNVYQPTFVGLTDGRVIKKGESVEFQLVWPLKGIAPTEASATSPRNLTWSFGIKEKPAYTFRFSPAY